MIVLGITGQSGTGKTTVAGMLADRGAACLDMDLVAREIVEPGSPALCSIRTAFGEGFLLPDGTLDRRKLGKVVFSDPAALQKLNSITHPELVRKARTWLSILEESSCPPSVAVIDAAVLFESGLAELVDIVIVTRAKAVLQVERISLRDGIPYDDALARVHAQKPLDEMIGRADYVIRTDCTIEETAKQVDNLWRLVRGA